MARIWYSVQGDGMGHAIRSHTIIQHLIKKHEVIITAADKAYPYMKKKYGKKVYKIYGEHWKYKDNTIDKWGTLKEFLSNRHLRAGRNFRQIMKIIREFKPDLAISDFESSAFYFSLILKLPCIALDNIHVLSECDIKIPKNKRHMLLITRNIIKLLYPKVDKYIITSFADVKIKNRKRTTVVPPIVRDEVRRLKPENKDFVLVYQTTPTNESMLSVLRKSKNKFRIYGMGKKKSTKNICFYEFSEKGFFNDIRKCKYVIINGGFNVISESIYLKKPMLAIPIETQFEQFFNAYSIKDKGYGSYTEKLTEKDILSFEKNFHLYKKNILKTGLWDNSRLFSKLDKTIKSTIAGK